MKGVLTMLWFTRQEVYVGCSFQDFSKTRTFLEQHGIPCDYRVVDHSQEWSGRGGTMRSQFGSAGVNPAFEKVYYLYVKKADYELAVHLIRDELRI